MAYNPLHKLQDNIEAIRIALDNKVPVETELAALQRYSGFGGIKGILYHRGSVDERTWLEATKEDLRLYQHIQQLHELLRSKLDESGYKEAANSLKNSVLTAFYTPRIIPDTIYSLLRDRDIPVISLYEPSGVSGAFVENAAHYLKGLQHITAVEKEG